MLERSKRGFYDLSYDPKLPKIKILSEKQNPTKQIERITEEYEKLLSLAHDRIINEKADKKRFYEVYSNENISAKDKSRILRRILINFYDDWNDELTTLTEYLNNPNLDNYWHVQGERYNILRPLPDFLNRRTYDSLELDLVPYKDVYRMKQKQPRKIPVPKQITNFSSKSISFILCNINSKKSSKSPSLKKNIQTLHNLINSKPSSPNEPTLPKYHGCIPTTEGFIYR